jgi:GNAT superfamily N-acetyltransferase
MVHHRLTDGTAVRIRPVDPDDKAQLAAGLRALSRDTIHKRFLAAKPRFSSSELRYLTEIDGVNHLALVALLPERSDQLIAVARCVRMPDRPDTAEFAIVVGDPWQAKGLGTRLSELLADAARRVGIRRFAGTMLGDNVAAERLMQTFATRLEWGAISGGVREVYAELAA